MQSASVAFAVDVTRIACRNKSGHLQPTFVLAHKRRCAAEMNLFGNRDSSQAFPDFAQQRLTDSFPLLS